MSGIHFEIKDKKGIEELGFVYEPDDTKCRGHMFNNLPMEVDWRDMDLPLDTVEEDIDLAFRLVLEGELKEAGVKRVNSVTWDRFFQIGEEWNPRKFKAIFYVRILCVDEEKLEDSHVCRA